MAPGHSMPDDAQEDNSAWNEMRLLYPTDPATTRGAGNNPGLGSSQRGFSFAQNDNPNTPFVSARTTLPCCSPQCVLLGLRSAPPLGAQRRVLWGGSPDA